MLTFGIALFSIYLQKLNSYYQKIGDWIGNYVIMVFKHSLTKNVYPIKFNENVVCLSCRYIFCQIQYIVIDNSYSESVRH